MELTKQEQAMLDGKEGYAVRKSMEILVALGDIFDAQHLIDVGSVQVAGVSYHNLGDAGLEFLNSLAKDGRVKVLTTLNPAGMDLENWQQLGIDPDFAKKQNLVIDAFQRMDILVSCTCTPYLIGNLPIYGEHLAWSESSAVTFANSVLGARTNREGGPSALAAAFVGKTPCYGLHLDENRVPNIHVEVNAELSKLSDWGALGYAIGKKAENKIAYITNIKTAQLDELKSFCASMVTYGTKPLFYIKGITPGAELQKQPDRTITIDQADLKNAYDNINDENVSDIDFVCVGCPHCSIKEIQEIAELLRDKKVKEGTELWVASSRTVKQLSDKRGYTATIEAAGGKFACDTCMAVAPLKGRFKALATTSAKGCFYSRQNLMKTKMGSMKECIDAAVTGKWN
ncbi:aconitase X catalytic domain-containing protein [Candidatus Bathycorpusculum sp.]|uniref:aconitase X catalytic domain-containing protein n=1 Tax=Candidatus Bathycorpusculum sp. TaxID=2994959 RepID=UPI0028339259|nr:aconitase X catalytic domain-containing protein [Candidatus Termitimicrobium sp.]MCL2432099.1 aconitase X catalytic domain-containing protein [Candidatus Termitimicrobium sp.]